MMTPEDSQKLEEYIEGIAQILYQNTQQEQLETFETIEITVRNEMLTKVAPRIGEFFLTQDKK
jgi:hypothetical protein